MIVWKPVSACGKHGLAPPDGFTLSGSVSIYSATTFLEPTANTLWWTTVNMWQDSEGVHALVNNYQLVGSWDA